MERGQGGSTTVCETGGMGVHVPPVKIVVVPQQKTNCLGGKGGNQKPKPENPVLKKNFATQTETDTYSAKFLKT